MIQRDQPTDVGRTLVVDQYKIFGELLEELARHAQSLLIKRCMNVSLFLTVSRHYKNLPNLDDFVFRCLDLSPAMLQQDFSLQLPVVHRLVVYGGKRVQSVLFQKRLHLHLSEMLRRIVAILCTEAEMLRAQVLWRRQCQEVEEGGRDSLDECGPP